MGSHIAECRQPCRYVELCGQDHTDHIAQRRTVHPPGLCAGVPSVFVDCRGGSLHVRRSPVHSDGLCLPLSCTALRTELVWQVGFVQCIFRTHSLISSVRPLPGEQLPIARCLAYCVAWAVGEVRRRTVSTWSPSDSTVPRPLNSHFLGRGRCHSRRSTGLEVCLADLDHRASVGQ